jgi:CheY-like chemotaxis protein
MRMLLEGWGCTVITAADDTHAVKELKRTGKTPDALIADYHLDRGHGLSAIRAIRKATRADLKAILLTADRTAELRDRAAILSVHMLNKPLKPAALRAWLSQIGIQRS